MGWSPSLHGRLTSSEKNCLTYTVEPLYRGHIGTPLAVLYTMEPLYRGHIGTPLAVLYREVSLIQRWICTQPYVVGTADSVLIREVLYSECPL